MEDVILSRLQLVQHALEALGDSDQVVFVTFQTQIQLVLPSTKLSNQGKEVATVAIEEMIPNGCTNIWAALELGLEEANKLRGQPVNTALLFFTDENQIEIHQWELPLH